LIFAILSAIYANEQNISDKAVIRDILSALDLDVEAVESLRDTMEIENMFHEATEQAIEMGVFGSPSYVVNGEDMFFGQDRLVDLEAHLLSLTA